MFFDLTLTARATETETAQYSIMTNKAATTPHLGEKTKQATNFTPMEDMLCIKVYFWESENSIDGAKQKGKKFEKKIEDTYRQLVTQQLDYEKETIMSNLFKSSSEKAVLFEKATAKYPFQSGSSLQQRVKQRIMPSTMKMVSIKNAVSVQLYLLLLTDLSYLAFNIII